MTQRYDTYKDSGVQWLGEIPGHWRCVPFRRIATVKSNLVHPYDYLDFPQVSPDCIEKDSGRLISWKTVADSNVESDNHRFYKGQIIYSKIRPLLNKVIIAPFDGLCSADMYPIETTTDTKYMQYYMLSNLFLSEVRNVIRDRVKMPKINKEELGQVNIIIPPLSEQSSIVSYLDDKCGKVDKMLEGKQKQIELLAEMKQRIIADAVTHGLNPDVKMKATNIPWLPEIPEHWACVKLKAFCKSNTEKNKGNIELCVLSLSYGSVIIKQNINFGLVPENYESYQVVNPGYIILRLTDLQNDHKSLRTGLVKHRGIITSAYVGLIVNGMNSEYVQLLLHSYDVMKVFYGMGGGLRQSMSYQDISNLYIPVPPLTEQQAIVSYLDDKTAKIDALTSKLQQEIESIKEYKQRLISDVVTGQIKVC